ncbi:hypothetical protein ACTHTU_11095, partial [Neisseria sp. P0020.S005]|uniref:hypothetical protein n=1 Tax=Neisseria sp. P0020.S005 TaxID=3436810 RepID=UPI003F810D66
CTLAAMVWCFGVLGALWVRGLLSGVALWFGFGCWLCGGVVCFACFGGLVFVVLVWLLGVLWVALVLLA